MDEQAADVDPRRVRIGLVMIAIIFVASVVLFFVADDGLGKAIFFGVAVVCIVRVAMLTRWLRRSRATG